MLSLGAINNSIVMYIYIYVRVKCDISDDLSKSMLSGFVAIFESCGGLLIIISLTSNMISRC